RELVELIKKVKPTSVLEVGCGLDQLFTLVQECGFIENWIVVEPSDMFIASAREQLSNDKRVHFFQGFIEDVVEKENLDNFDLCIVSGLLHEVQEPKVILHAVKQTMGRAGMLHVNVPNADSMHRRLAVNMGLITSVKEESGRNKSLLQSHVFNMEDLKEMIGSENLEVVDAGGYFVKPFTHTQMEKVIAVVGSDVLDGLWTLGQQFPELASEIYINAKLSEENS
ncbi:MAG: class I SAM-dependent methyltransferase, partial [Mariprofundaceae bacterium]|nr:class I SAM-dependent methyltransferase [Mariprofundaceae bacterium]